MFRVIPIVAMLAGIGFLGTQGKDYFEAVSRRVKVLLTGLEVRNIGEEMRFRYLADGTVPGANDDDEFHAFLRQNFKPYWGNRDPAYDLFEEYFRLEPGGRADPEYVIFSTGPNREWDECALLNGSSTGADDGDAGADDICVSLEFALRDTAFRHRE